MGDEIKLGEGMKLSARLPLRAFIGLLRHGTEILTADGKAGSNSE